MAKKSAAKPKTTDAAPEQPTMTKVGAARQAIADGVTVPAEASAYIKTKFGIDVSPSRFATIKYESSKKSAKPRVTVLVGKPVKAAPIVVDDSKLLAALEALKPLVAEFGVDKVKRLVDLLG